MSDESGIIVIGLTEGKNFPIRENTDKPFIDLTNCRNIVVMDSEYFDKTYSKK